MNTFQSCFQHGLVKPNHHNPCQTHHPTDYSASRHTINIDRTILCNHSPSILRHAIHEATHSRKSFQPLHFFIRPWQIVFIHWSVGIYCKTRLFKPMGVIEWRC